MKFYDTAVYETNMTEMDAQYERCDKCEGRNTFPHTCRWYCHLADTETLEEAKASWCTRERKEA